MRCKDWFKNKCNRRNCTYFILAIILFSQIVGQTILVTAEDNQEIQIENTKQSNKESDDLKKEFIKNSSVSNNTDINKTIVETSSPSLELFHDFAPPSESGGGYPIYGEGDTDAEIREWVRKYGLSRILSLTKVIKDGVLGDEVGDQMNITVPVSSNMHLYVPMFENAPSKIAESWYGFINLTNLTATSQDDAIKIDVTKQDSNYNLVVTRLKEDKKTAYDISLSYSGLYPYYASMYGYIVTTPVWSKWWDAGSLELDSNTLDMSIEAEPSSDKLKATPNSQSISLGSSAENIVINDLVKDVKFGDRALERDEYTVSLQNTIATDTVGTKTAQIRVSYNADPTKTLSLDVPIQVLWGHTIGSNNVIYKDRTAFSLSLVTYEKPNIIATFGSGSSGAWINDYQSGTYISTKVYKDSQILNSSQASAYISLALTGRDSIITSTDKWNKLSGRGNLEYGDVIQYDVQTAWRDNNWVMRDEQQKFESLSKQSIYYEITKDGYKTLHLNHLQVNNSSIPIYSTKAYLDEHINDYIDLKGYKNISIKEFSQYPDTRSSGQKKGRIIIEELLTTGKKVQFEYEVTFTVGEGELSYSVPELLEFKDFSKSKVEQLVQRKSSKNLGIYVNDSRGAGKQGNWQLTAQVEQSEDLSPYFIFKDNNSQEKHLNQGAVEIYSQSKQDDPQEPLDIDVSGEWTENTGLLLRVPSKNDLSSQQYSSVITWNLVEGP